MNARDDAQDSASQLHELWEAHALTGAASDMVYDVLRDALISRVIQPGQRLAEEQLARVFNVSRTPIREALFRLEAEGFAERIPRRGLIAKHVTPQEIIDVYVVRESTDGLAAELAAGCATPSDISMLTWLTQQFAIAATAESLDDMVKLNLQFHESIAQISRNIVLIDIVRQIHHRVRRFPGTTFAYPGRAEKTIQEHQRLIDAIASHDAPLARQLAIEHMTTASNIRIAMLKADPENHL